MGTRALFHITKEIFVPELNEPAQLAISKRPLELKFVCASVEHHPLESGAQPHIMMRRTFRNEGLRGCNVEEVYVYGEVLPPSLAQMAALIPARAARAIGAAAAATAFVSAE